VAGRYAAAVRVIGGSCRGRTLRAPAGPTSDRVREAIFNVLSSVIDLPGTDVVDLFAGSGAMGIEALSRGASSAVFVDQDLAAVRAMRQNVSSLEMLDRARVVREEVVRFLGRPHRFDLALCDPPYAFSAWDQVLTRVHASVAVLESSHAVQVPVGWEIIKNKRYGDTLVTVVRSLGASEKGTL